MDVDSDTLFLLSDFKARVQHRQVRLRLSDGAECIVGEINVLLGLGSPTDLSQHAGKVRISFHDIQDDSCVDPPPYNWELVKQGSQGWHISGSVVPRCSVPAFDRLD